MTGGQAAGYVQQAAAKESGGRVTGLRSRCARASATGFNCSASWKRGTVSYAGRFAITHQASSKLARYKTALSGISAQTVFTGSASGRRVRWAASLPLLRSVQPLHPLS